MSIEVKPIERRFLYNGITLPDLKKHIRYCRCTEFFALFIALPSLEPDKRAPTTRILINIHSCRSHQHF